MARNNSGVLGAFIGTIGPVTGFMRNGQNIVRTSSSSIKNKRTPLQLAQGKRSISAPVLPVHFQVQDFLIKAFLHTGIQARVITVPPAL